VSYVYNGFGQRVRKTNTAATYCYVYDFDGNLVAEPQPNGNTGAEYLYNGSQRLAKVISGNIFHYHNNQMGTPELMTAQNNTVVWEASYDPFGRAYVNEAATRSNPFRFPGQQYDSETGLHYNYFRYYNPKLGRYLTPDPIGLAGGINPYVYVLNDPINAVDPWGLQQRRGLGPDLMYNPLMGGGGSPNRGGGGGGGSIRLYRAVTQAELADLNVNSGKFRNPAGIETKYFSTTEEGAACYARQAYRAGEPIYEGPYTIVETEIPSAAISAEMRVTVDRGVNTIVVPSGSLPLLSPARALGQMIAEP
jgi:RHS repeat-associated protein